MALDECTPALESKTSKWTAGGKRTQQFYGCRHDLYWTLSTKTRQPADAMRAAFGEDLDVITLLALERTSVVRDWQRFDSEYEVVDLGRNKKKAEATLSALQVEARQEGFLLGNAEPKMLDKVLKWCVQTTEGIEEARINAATRAKAGLWNLFSNSLQSDLRTEVARPFAQSLSLLLLTDKVDLLIALQKTITELHEECADYVPMRHGDFEDTLRPMLWQQIRPSIINNLNGFLSDANDEWEARKVLVDRRATVEKTATTLAKLGFKTSDL